MQSKASYCNHQNVFGLYNNIKKVSFKIKNKSTQKEKATHFKVKVAKSTNLVTAANVCELINNLSVTGFIPVVALL